MSEEKEQKTKNDLLKEKGEKIFSQIIKWFIRKKQENKEREKGNILGKEKQLRKQLREKC